VITHKETVRALESTLAMVADDHRRFIEYQTLLILYFQQITPYVDTKDRHVAGLMHGLAAGLSALGDEFQKRWEWMVAHERRYENQVNDVRTTLSVMQRAVQTMKREVEETQRARLKPSTTITEPTTTEQTHEAPTSQKPSTGAASSLDSYKYVGFEDQFRGSEHDIRERLMAYVPMFEGASDVLDVGCGRGEFLELLRERGVTARGVDVNDEMVAVCRERGLDATAADALSYLNSLPDGTLGGLFAAQVVEHLEPGYLMRFLESAYHKLRPGSKIVLETINPACWFAFFSSYIRDITHQRPLHPDTLQYLVRASGFQNVTVRYSAPYPNESKLQRIAAEEAESPAQAAMATVVNDNVTKLNSLLFTYLDYAAIGERM
jgi:SAM-dependent methyltransferase